MKEVKPTDKVLKKRNGKVTQVYRWAVEYSRQKSKERKLEKQRLLGPK